MKQPKDGKRREPDPEQVGKPVQRVHAEECIVCHQILGLVGGYGNTGMCGPCCTGEAETVEEYGEMW